MNSLMMMKPIMLLFLSLKYTKSIQHIALTLHTAHYILYIIYTHSPQGRLAGLLSFSPVCSSTESSGSGPSHDQATVNSSVSELEDPEADDQVVSLLSKLRAPRPSILASHTLSGSGLRDYRLVEARAYSRKTSRLFPFYALRLYTVDTCALFP